MQEVPGSALVDGDGDPGEVRDPGDVRVGLGDSPAHEEDLRTGAPGTSAMRPAVRVISSRAKRL